MGVKILIRKNGKKIKEIFVDGEKVKKIDAGTQGKDLVTGSGPSTFPIVMFHGGKFYFAIPPDTFKGELTRKNVKVALGELVSKGLGKESQGLIWGIVDDNTMVVLLDGDQEIIIAGSGVTIPVQSEATEPQKVDKAKKEEKKEKKGEAVGGMALAGAGGPVVTYFDFHSMRRKSFYVYLGILSFTVIAAVVIMTILGTMELPPETNDITAIPTRFAKLIVEKVPKPEKKEEARGKGEEEKKAKAEQKMEETKEEEKAATGNVNEQARREAIKKKVRRVGVLAILTSKGGQGLVQDVVSAAGNIGDLDSVLSQMGGVQTAKAGMDIDAIKKTRLGGAAASADIGSLGVGPGQKVSLGSKKIRRVRASINLGGGRISGALAGEVIRRVVKRNIRGVKYCYEKELKKNPKLSGKIVVLFTIGMNGRVKKARIQSTTMHNENVESCILRMIKRWRFPRPEKGSVTVSYPFIFTPGS